jgi:16S rRNA (cytosine1402-N4)-methyltransferase
LDIGVSSRQIDQAERGFSFSKDGPLDMRMGLDGLSAADLVNQASETQLADIIYHYGEERLSRRVARAIVERRKQAPFTTTAELADVIRSVVPKSKDGIDPATRTFQALRVAVNDELGELERGLSDAEHLLDQGGRLAVVTFHSLEDRIVKDFMKSSSGGLSKPSRHIPMTDAIGPAPSFTPLTRKPVVAGSEELSKNPRSRSAHLRAAVRTAAPAISRPLHYGSLP